MALLVENHGVRYALLLVLNFFLIYTGYGVFMSVITLAVFALDCYRQQRGSLSAVPLAYSVSGLVSSCRRSLGSFFLNYSFLPAIDWFTFPVRDLTTYPRFMALLFSSFLGLRRPVGFPTAAGAVGLAFALAVEVIYIYRLLSFAAKGCSKSQLPDLINTVLLSYSLLFAVVTAVGRVCAGLPDRAQPGRYSTLMIPAIVAIYFFLLLLPQTIFRKIALAAFLVVVAPGGAPFPDFVGTSGGREVCLGRVLSPYEGHRILRSSDRFPNSAKSRPQRVKGELEYLKQNRLSFFYTQ